MNDNYYRSQRSANRIMDSPKYLFSQDNNSFNKISQFQKTPSFQESKLLNNFENSNGKEELIQNEEDIDHLQQFHLEKENNPFIINTNRNNNLNTNKIPKISFSNSLQSKNQFNRQITGKIPHPKKTQGMIPIDKNKVGMTFFQNKRNCSGEKPPVKKIQSKYSSVSENRYHFMNKCNMQKFDLANITEIDTKINYAPFDLDNGLKNYRISRSIKDLDITKQKINRYSTNYNNTGMLLNRTQNPKISQSFIPKVSNIKKKFDQRENRFSENPSLTNSNYQTVNGNKLQDRIQLVKIGQNKNNQEQKNNNSMQFYPFENSTSITEISDLKMNNANYVSPRTTISYKYLNEDNRSRTPFFRSFNQNEMQERNEPIVFTNNKRDEYQNSEITLVTNIAPSLENSQLNNNRNTNFVANQKLSQIMKENNQYLDNIQMLNNQIPQLSQQELNKLLGKPSNSMINAKRNQFTGKNYIVYTPKSERPSMRNSNATNKFSTFKNAGVKYSVKSYNAMSRPGKDVSGETKTNQDAYVCKTNIKNIKDFNIFGVSDGHGPDGHFVSEFVSEFIPSKIINHSEIINLTTTEKVYAKLKENGCKIIKQAFISTDNQLKNMEFDVSESGCTCCLVIQIGNHILCANTGDSRAIVVYDQSNEINSKNLDLINCEPLSTDFKPELPEEMRRITLAGGVVEQMKDEYGEGIGPYRVWIKGKDHPGLAMSRSIGDLKGKTVGVIPDPGILEYDLDRSTKYIIICSDGVWEFLDNEKVMNFGKKFYLQNNPNDFCQELISKANETWEKNESIVDDITAVAVFY